jgi:hypothetical protein
MVLAAIFAGASLEGWLVYLAALPAAILLGFAAIWAPSGIGVREGAIMLVLMLEVGAEHALAIALFYRAWCVMIDLAFGIFTLTFLRVASRRRPLAPLPTLTETVKADRDACGGRPVDVHTDDRGHG